MQQQKANAYAILTVDDEEAVLKLIGQHLDGLPYVIIPTTSPAEAIHILQTRDIAVLLCDLHMPDIDGNQVLNAAREFNPNIVSIVVTGSMDMAATVRAINEGGLWKFIAKPWKREDLIDLVNDGVARYIALCRQQSQLTQLAREITDQIRKEETKAMDSTPRPRRKKRKKTVRHVGMFQKALQKIGLQKPKEVPGHILSSKRYRLVEVLGEGGMGAVYKADDMLLGMPVAIKVLSPKFTRDEFAVSTLKQEARIAMRLSHRHIVRIHNLQKTGNHFFLVMEYVQGSTFRDILKRYGRLPMDSVLQVVRVCADALAYAHRHEVLHRDLKPTNLMLSEDGVLKIIDFGVSCLISSQRNTRDILGTPVYMSPEQIRGKDLDNRTDIYSLGIITYELLTGNRPFPEEATGKDVLKVGTPILEGLVEPIRQVLQKAVSTDRDERWPSVEAFAAALINAADSIPAP